MDRILLGDNLPLLRAEPDASVTMAYLDPPFNTGRSQVRRTLEIAPDANGDRTGFGGRRYASRLLEQSSYRDEFDDYLGFLAPRLAEVRRLLTPDGTLYFHIDYREAHYCKLLLDELFGREQAADLAQARLEEAEVVVEVVAVGGLLQQPARVAAAAEAGPVPVRVGRDVERAADLLPPRVEGRVEVGHGDARLRLGAQQREVVSEQDPFHGPRAYAPVRRLAS